MGSHISRFIKGKKHGRMMLDSIDNSPLVYLTVEEDRQTRPKKYSKLTEAQQLQDDCDVHATNIILHGLPSDVYALVNHQEAGKDIWDTVKLLMKGTELSYQERECRFYNLFDKMTIWQVQVNTKFLNALPPEWSKFVTDVKLANILYTTNYDHLYSYLSQHERHANEERLICEKYPDPLALIANSQTLYNPSQQPFKMEESPFNKFKEDKLRALLALETKELLQPPGKLYSVIAKEHDVSSVFDAEETLIFEEESRSKMLDKKNDPISIENKIKISPIDYSKLNKIKEYFGKRFVTKEELSAEQAFWLKRSNYNPDTSVKSHTHVRIETPNELPKLSLKDIDVIETINIELKHSVAKLLYEYENLRKEQEHLKSNYKDQFDSIRKICVQSKEHSASLIAQINTKSVENSDLNAQLQEKVFSIKALKNVVYISVSKPSATIASGMFKLDIEPISRRLKNNRDAHEVYIEQTIENTDTLRGLVECARKQNPSEPLL
uniref:Integrase, catalytic region, zinc finger, CCHC-type, peptidase aspartic, catalytic n=1 Tax=Tanacetum cinerariifolium TaxID=118510 RepID=A0A6L2N1G3_TANCI|nr:hypothetical protein [Tanacetum cinerariifolium]